MAGSLLFVHGTGAHGIDGTLRRLEQGLARRPRLRQIAVHGAAWGTKVGPADLDVGPALPPEEVTRALTDEPTELEITVQEWALLAADPLLELRLLAALAMGAGAEVLVAADPADVVVQERLRGLGMVGTVAPEPMLTAGIDRDALAAAAENVANAPETTEAAAAVGDPDDAELVTTASRAVVATLLRDCAAGSVDDATGPALCRDGGARDALVDAVAVGLAPVGTRGLGAQLVRKVVKPLASKIATRVAVRRRGDLMDPTTDFVRDIAFYIRRGGVVRDFIATEVAGLAPPVVILGHSLGGIAAVDLMSSSQRPPSVRLLVTAGSQAPYLFLMDALDALRPNGQVAPFSPWLNVYDRADLLSFCAQRVFSHTGGITDAEVASGVPFPESHSAYWEQERLYELLEQHWPS